MNPKVDEFFSKAQKWQEELEQLRLIVLECGLTEELKWGVPTYTFKGKNIVLIHGFKEYFALLFMHGSLLSDINGILIQQTENVQSGRQIRFTNAVNMYELKSVLKEYIFEAIEVEKTGIKNEYKKTEDFPVPEEFQQKLNENAALKMAFEKLTPGRQKGYLLFFNGASQAKTRETRVEKYTERILKGFGFNDCVCGLSKKMPNCDGSHRYINNLK
jgi:uncharacterized protein YdeI (YjbR/CyaY-like superfamily)